MKKLFVVVFYLVCSTLVGCSDDNDSDGNMSVLAPASAAGKSYTFSIDSGSGSFAPNGSFVVTIASSGNTYVVDGDDVTVGNSVGTYSYEAIENRGRISFNDSASGQGLFELIYLDEKSGDFVSTIVSDSQARQEGTFRE